MRRANHLRSHPNPLARFCTSRTPRMPSPFHADENVRHFVSKRVVPTTEHVSRDGSVWMADTGGDPASPSRSLGHSGANISLSEHRSNATVKNRETLLCRVFANFLDFFSALWRHSPELVPPLRTPQCRWGGASIDGASSGGMLRSRPRLHALSPADDMRCPRTFPISPTQ